MIPEDPPPTVCIVGKNKLQYDLLAFCLKKELLIECTYQTQKPQSNLASINTQARIIWLFDCLLCNSNKLEKLLKNYLEKHTFNLLIALFNAPKDHSLDRLIKPYKIRGLFYKDDSSEIFLKGIRHILKGHLWLSRKTMSNCILNYKSHPNPSFAQYNTLSCREKVILQNIASGASNQEIADNLNISVHTVKTHLYKIYRKINVPNRLQASIWANLEFSKSSR